MTARRDWPVYHVGYWDEAAILAGLERQWEERQPHPGPRPLTTKAEVEAKRAELSAAGLPAGERSVATALGVSRDPVRYVRDDAGACRYDRFRARNGGGRAGRGGSADPGLAHEAASGVVPIASAKVLPDYAAIDQAANAESVRALAASGYRAAAEGEGHRLKRV